MALQPSSAFPADNSSAVCPQANRQNTTFAKLVSTHPRLGGQVFELGLGEYLLGSSSQCDILVTIDGVADRHCTLQVTEGANGHEIHVKSHSHLSWINDGIANGRQLRIGDRLILGPVAFKVLASTPAEPVSKPVEQTLAQATEQILEQTSEQAPALPTVSDSESKARNAQPTDSGAENPEGKWHPEDLPQIRLEKMLRGHSEALSGDLVDQSEGVRRQEHVEELLTEIQAALDSVIERERSMQSVFDQEQEQLSQKSEELSSQWKEFEQAKVEYRQEQSKLEQSHLQFQREVESLQETRQLLEDRYGEMARRASELARSGRAIKRQTLELNSMKVDAEETSQAISVSLHSLNEQSLQIIKRSEELDNREAQLKISLEQIRKDRSRLSDREATIEEEEQLWAQKLQSREKYLSDLEAELNQRNKKVSKQELNFKQHLEQELEAAKLLITGMDSQEVEQFKADHSQLLKDQSAIAAQREEMAQDLEQFHLRQEQFDLSVADFETLKLQLQAEREEFEKSLSHTEESRKDLEIQFAEIAEIREALAVERQALDQQIEEFTNKQVSLDTASLELEHLQRELVESRANFGDMDERERELSQKSEQLESRLADLDADQQNLVKLRVELEAERSRDVYDRTQIENRSKQLETIQSEQLARELEILEQSTALKRSQEEFEAQRAAFLIESESRTETSGESEELIAARAHIAELTEQLESLQKQTGQTELLVAELTSKLESAVEERVAEGNNRQIISTELHEYRESLERKEAELTAGWESLEESREVLKQQLLQLKMARETQANTEAAAQTSPEHDLNGENSELLQHDSLLVSRYEGVDEDHPEHGDDQELFNRINHQLDHAQSLTTEESEAETEAEAEPGTSSLLSLFLDDHPVKSQRNHGDDRETDHLQTEADLASRSSDQVEEDSSAQEDLETRELRSQLASLFGIPEVSESTHGEGRTRRYETEQSYEEPNSHDHSHDDFHDQDETEVRESSSLMSPVQEQPEPVEAEQPQAEVSEEDEHNASVESYMKRLLERSRANEPTVATPAPKPRRVTDESDEPLAETSTFEDEARKMRQARRARKLEDGEKEQIRAGLDSFRDLANFSARSAIASSKATQTAALMKAMLGLSAIGWVSTAAMLVSSWTLQKSMFFEMMLVGGVSAILTVLSLIRLWEVRQMTIVSEMPSQEDENEENLARKKPSDREKSQLTFL